MQRLLLVQGLTLRTAAVGTGQLLRKRQIQLYTDPHLCGVHGRRRAWSRGEQLRTTALVRAGEAEAWTQAGVVYHAGLLGCCWGRGTPTYCRDTKITYAYLPKPPCLPKLHLPKLDST